MSLFTIENVTFGYAEHTLLKHVDIRLLPREHAALVGANGAGKTTLMKLLNGQLLPDDGRILQAENARIGFLDQLASLPSGMTIRQVLLDAFAPLLEKEKALTACTEALAHAPHQTDLLHRMGVLQEALEAGDFYHIDTQVDQVAAGLGITALGMNTPADTLSGGQRAKVRIARLLLEKPDVLLLDEPTNHLDAPHITWLADTLSAWPGAFLVISHDAVFLDRICNSIWHLEFSNLTKYPGNHSKFLRLSTARREGHLQAYGRQQEEIAKMEDFIRKNITRAATTGRAQSRQKALARMERVEKPQSLPVPRFTFPIPTPSDRVVTETADLVIGYDRALLPPLNLRLERGEKVAVTGGNGIGKTTLLRTLLGDLPPFDGLCVQGREVRPLYYEQECIEGREWTALAYVMARHPQLTRKQAQAALARCGLTPIHMQREMAALSGGEQARARLCALMLGSGNLLVLDEPTNHLDPSAREALKKALTEWTGTILAVSHDKAFTSGWADTVWDLGRLRKSMVPPHAKGV